MSGTWPESMSLGNDPPAAELASLPMRQLATMAGISNPYLSQIERGLREPSQQVLNALADSLQMSAESLRSTDTFGSNSDNPSAVVEAIDSDPDLTAQQRKALKESYEAFRELTVERRRGKGRQRRP